MSWQAPYPSALAEHPHATVVSGPAAYGSGGVGHHLRQIIEDVRTAYGLQRYFAPVTKEGDERGVTVRVPALATLFRCTPLRFSPGWKTYLTGDLFDRAVARQLHERPGVLVAFSGAALHTFRRARALGCRRFELVALNNHPDTVLRQQARAYADWPLERGWMNTALVAKQRQEYAEADVIHVSSAHLARTLIEAGISERKLQLTPLTADPRFEPPADPERGGRLRVVYVGSLSVYKGIPVLVEAFHRIPDPEAELVLVGGWASRGMRRYLKAAVARDPRIRIAPGDPLPHLQRATVVVHPSYDDAFGLAPVEALACGVPVIVTDQTGMKELVEEGESGWVVPAGDVGVLLDRLWLADESRRERRSVEMVEGRAL